jgi:hypothetical protein
VALECFSLGVLVDEKSIIPTIIAATLFFVAIALTIPAICKGLPSIKVEFRVEVN